MNNEIKINVPEGMEIDKENSTLECIKFKLKWIPERGDVVAAGRDHNQIILVAEYIKQNPIIGFDIKPLALLSKNGLSLYNNDSDVPTLWALEKAHTLEKELFINKLKERGYTYDPNDPRVLYKKEKEKEKELPKTWEEFCENNPVGDKECYINSFSQIKIGDTRYENRRRENPCDDNLLPSKEYAEAMLALCKLIQLRDCYNDGWKPDWINNKEEKYVIVHFKKEIKFSTNFYESRVLAFKTQQLREEFYNNFKDLIEQAKPLL